MAIPITVPRLGWNMEHGVFIGWLKADGEPVHTGDALFTLEGEKATEDIEGFEDGILHIPADGPRKGDSVAVGAVIGFVLQPGEKVDFRLHIADCRLETMKSEPAASPNPPAAVPLMRDRRASSPRARRAAAKLGVDLKDAKGSGRTGRIRERDVLAMAGPVRSTRRVIAERMVASHISTAPVTLMTTIDATRLVNLRKTWKVDPVPTFTDFFVKLTALALEKHPVLNARWDKDRVVSPDAIHIGIAVDTDAGLLVPVVRDVPRLGINELAKQSRDLIERTRQRTIAASELQGGTFTVTSLGAFGIDAFTPIINYPECAVLGIGRIRRCPVVVEDQIVIRDQVTLSLTFDHRITDGAPAARFLQSLSASVENPNFV